MERQSDLQALLCRKSVKMAAAFLAPVLILMLILNGQNMYPYKSLTLLTSDLNNQYVSFFAYFSDALKNGNDFFYTFSKAVGGDMYGLTGYYLLSPVNIILLFTDIEAMPVAIMLITFIKVGLSGLFMFIYLSKRGGLKYRNLMFAIAYALCGYMSAFIFNLMWLDAVYLLPLVILGLERIFDGRSMICYTGILSLTIISCYYTGYMVCIFAGIYGVYYVLTIAEKKRLKMFCKFAAGSLLGVAISMIALLPSLAALSGSKAVADGAGFSFETNFSFTDFFARLLTGSSAQTDGFSNLPNVYFGMVMLVFVIAFFLIKKISMKERIGTFLVFAILLASMYFTDIDMIWHGFAKPNMFYTRYSFVFIFFAVITAHKGYMAWTDEEAENKKNYVPAAAGAMAAVIMITGLAAANDVSNIKFAFMDAAFLGITVWVMIKYAHTEKILKPVLNILLLAAVIIGAFVNTNTAIALMYHTDNSIVGFEQEVSPCLEYIESKSPYMHRVEKNFYYSLNDPMLLGYNGLSHFSSTEKGYVKDFMKNMGYMAYYQYWTHFGNGSTIAADSFLGVKYVMSRDDYEKYNIIGKSETVGVYENPYALPLVFAASENVLDSKLSGDNVFEFQNNLYFALTGDKKRIFEKLSYDEKYSEEGVVHYLITAKDSKRIYMYIPEQEIGAITVSVNKQDRGSYFAENGNGIVIIGAFSPGNVVDVAISCEGADVDLPLIIYSENNGILEEYIKPMQASCAGVTKHTSSNISASVSVGSDGVVMTSIPYDEGWSVYVDGRKAETYQALDAMLAVKTGEGNFEIVFKYVPKYFAVSAAISGMALLVYAVIILYTLRRRRIEKEKEKADALQSV